MFLQNFLSSFGQYRITLAYLVSLPIVGVAATYCRNWWRQQQAKQDALDAEELLLADTSKPKAKRRRSKAKKQQSTPPLIKVEETVPESSDLEDSVITPTPNDLLVLAKLQGIKAPVVTIEDAAMKEEGDEWTRVATKQEELASHWKQKYEQVNEAWQREQVEQEQEKRRLEQNAARLQQQEQGLREQVRSISQHMMALETEAHGLRHQNRDLVQKFDQSMQEASALRQRAEMVDSISNDLESKKAELSKVISELEVACKAKEASLKREEQLKSELSNASVKLGHAQEEIKSQREIINGLESYRSRFTTLEIEATARGQMLHKAERDLAQIQERLLQSQKEKAALEGKMKGLEQDYEEILAKLPQLERRLADATSLVDATRGEAEQLRDHLEVLKGERVSMEERTQAMLDAERAARHQLETELAQAHEQLRLEKQAVEKLDLEKEQLRQQQQQQPSPSDELLAVKKKFAELLHQLSDLRHERDAHRKQNAQLMVEIEQLQLKLNSQESKHLAMLDASREAEGKWSAQLLETVANLKQ